MSFWDEDPWEGRLEELQASQREDPTRRGGSSSTASAEAEAKARAAKEARDTALANADEMAEKEFEVIESAVKEEYNSFFDKNNLASDDYYENQKAKVVATLTVTRKYSYSLVTVGCGREAYFCTMRGKRYDGPKDALPRKILKWLNEHATNGKRFVKIEE